MKLSIEFDRETNGDWIAEIPELPGVMVYGATKEEAIRNVEVLALQVIVDKMENGELASISDLIFTQLDAA